MNYLSKQCPSIGSEPYLRHVTAEEIRRVFREHLEEVEWLALFLTGNEELATVCMVDACAVAAAPNDVFVQLFGCWIRGYTIRSAIEMQQVRIAELASFYERRPCDHREHAPLASEDLDLLYERPDKAAVRIDVLCRLALVLRGIEGYSPVESARILGVSPTVVEAAYCAALQALEVVTCEVLVESETAAQRCC